MQATAAPAYLGNPKLVDPEEAFVASLGLGLTGISFVAAPLAAGWCALSPWLGRRQAALAKQRNVAVPERPRLRKATRPRTMLGLRTSSSTEAITFGG